jgi:hypothetical protein
VTAQVSMLPPADIRSLFFSLSGKLPPSGPVSIVDGINAFHSLEPDPLLSLSNWLSTDGIVDGLNGALWMADGSLGEAEDAALMCIRNTFVTLMENCAYHRGRASTVLRTSFVILPCFFCYHGKGVEGFLFDSGGLVSGVESGGHFLSELERIYGGRFKVLPPSVVEPGDPESGDPGFDLARRFVQSVLTEGRLVDSGEGLLTALDIPPLLASQWSRLTINGSFCAHRAFSCGIPLLHVSEATASTNQVPFLCEPLSDFSCERLSRALCADAPLSFTSHFSANFFRPMCLRDSLLFLGLSRRLVTAPVQFDGVRDSRPVESVRGELRTQHCPKNRSVGMGFSLSRSPQRQPAWSISVPASLSGYIERCFADYCKALDVPMVHLTS